MMFIGESSCWHVMLKKYVCVMWRNGLETIVYERESRDGSVMNKWGVDLSWNGYIWGKYANDTKKVR